MELTVNHVQKLHQEQPLRSLVICQQSEAKAKFRAGFSECARMVRSLLQAQYTVEPGLEQRLSEHLDRCLIGFTVDAQHDSPSRSPSPVSSYQASDPRCDSRSSFDKDSVLMSPQPLQKPQKPSPQAPRPTSPSSGSSPPSPRPLWGATNTNQSPFIRGPLTAVDLNSPYLTSCLGDATSNTSSSSTNGGSRIVSPECGTVGASVIQAPHDRCLPAIVPTQSQTPPSPCPSSFDEDEHEMSISSSGSRCSNGLLSQSTSPGSALDMRTQMGQIVTQLSQRQVVDSWAHVSLISQQQRIYHYQQQQHQLHEPLVSCSSRISLDDSLLWRPW